MQLPPLPATFVFLHVFFHCDADFTNLFSSLSTKDSWRSQLALAPILLRFALCSPAGPTPGLTRTFNSARGATSRGLALGPGVQGPMRGGFSDGEIEAALQEAEQLLGLDVVKSEAKRLQFASKDPPGRAEQHPRPLSAFSLNEEVMQLRIAAHEKDLELMELKAQLRQLSERSELSQRQLEQAVESQDATIAKLQQAVDLRERAIDNLATQLKGYQGVGPDAVAMLQREHATLSADKVALEAAVGDLRSKLAQQSQRLADSLACWERVQAELQAESAGLADALRQRTSDYQDLYQEKEVLRAKVSLLESRSLNALALVPATPAVPPLGLPAAHAAATERADQLQAKLEQRDATCRKYKEAVRALKRRVEGLESQLQQSEARGQRLSEQLAAAQQEQHAARQQQQAAAGESAGVVSRLEEQLKEARQQCEVYSGRLAEVDAQLQKAEFERAQWEWRAQDAEAKAQAGSEAAEASHAVTLRRAEQRAAAAEARAGEFESQAKSASLQVLQLEKQLQRLRGELDLLRQRHQASVTAEAARPQQQAAEIAQLQGQLRSKQAALRELQQRLVALESKHKQVEQSLQEQVQAKGVALADAEKRFRQLEAVMRRVASKKQQALAGEQGWAIGTEVSGS